MNLRLDAGLHISIDEKKGGMERPKLPKRQGSLLVDYTKNRAAATPPSKRLSLEAAKSYHGHQSHRRSISSRRASTGNHSLRRSKSIENLDRSSDEAILTYYMDGRLDTGSSRTPLNLYETKKSRRRSSGSASTKKKERQPSLLIEKKRNSRVSTVPECNSSVEDVWGGLSESTLSVTPSKQLNSSKSTTATSGKMMEEESIRLEDLQKPERDFRRRSTGPMDDTSTDDTEASTSVEDSVSFSLRRNVALSARSATFDATALQSSTDRLNESLLIKTSEHSQQEQEPLGRRSRLALARALHDSMKQLIVDLEEEEKEDSAPRPAKRSSSLGRSSSVCHTRSRSGSGRGDRRGLLAEMGSANNSMSKIINTAVTDTVNWLVEAANKPVHTLERASSLRELLSTENSFSDKRRCFPPERTCNRSMSGSNLMMRESNMSRSSLTRSSPYQRDTSRTRESSSNIMSSQSNNLTSHSSLFGGRNQDSTRSLTSNTNKTRMKNISTSKRESLRDFRRRSNRNLLRVEDDSGNSSSDDTVDHTRRRVGTDPKKKRHSRKNSMGEITESNGRGKLGRASSFSKVDHSASQNSTGGRRSTLKRSKTATPKAGSPGQLDKLLKKDRRRRLNRSSSASLVKSTSSGTSLRSQLRRTKTASPHSTASYMRRRMGADRPTVPDLLDESATTQSSTRKTLKSNRSTVASEKSPIRRQSSSMMDDSNRSNQVRRVMSSGSVNYKGQGLRRSTSFMGGSRRTEAPTKMNDFVTGSRITIHGMKLREVSF